MKQIRRRTARAILVPFALFVIVLGSALPASAAPIMSDTPDTSVPTAPTYSLPGLFSLKW